LENHLVPNGIADEIALAIPFDQARIVKGAELFGDITLLHASGVYQLGHGHGTTHEQLEQAQARGFGKRGKKPGGFLDLSII
jgi:hypothetical protein